MNRNTNNNRLDLSFQMASKLKTYREKRDFKKTPEPKAGTIKSSAAPVFVVQKHYSSTLHYDFRLEIDGVLKSWAVPKGPSTDPKDKRLAVATEDHPLEYKDFEGIIPEGEYGAGKVIIWDKGTYKNISDVSIQEGLRAGKIEIQLDGKKLKGKYILIRMQRGIQKNKKKPWLLIKSRNYK